MPPTTPTPRRRGPVPVRRHQPRHHRLAQAGRLLHRRQAAPVVTGQDAELPSVKSILAGEQTSTVFKDTRTLAAQVAKMVDQFLKGQTVDVNDTKTYENGVKIVPAYLLAGRVRDQGQRHEGARRHRLLQGRDQAN